MIALTMPDGWGTILLVSAAGGFIPGCLIALSQHKKAKRAQKKLNDERFIATKGEKYPWWGA